MVDISEKREEERIFRFSDYLPDLLGKPDVKDRVIEFLSGGVIFEDLDPVAGLQRIEERFCRTALLKADRDREPVGVTATVVEVDIRDVGMVPGRGIQKIEESPGFMGEKDVKFEDV